MNYNINEPKLLYSKDIIKISDSAFIEVGLYEKRKDVFYNVTLKLGSEEIFIGKFPKIYDSLEVKYKDGKILVYTNKFDSKAKAMKIIKVYSLYEISDDIFYSCTEEEALNIFDKNIDSSYLKNKDNLIYRTDVEKIRKNR